MQSAAIRLIGSKPTTFFGGQGQFEMEICDLINEVAQDIAKYQDWQALCSVHTITGDGTTEEFPLPPDYDRMLINSDVQDLNNWLWGYTAFNDMNQFLYHQARGFSSWPGGWIIYGGSIHFSPAPAAGESATFPYVRNKWAIGAQPKSQFDVDTDTFALPERLLTLGLIWRWRENKKLDASGDQEAFIKALDEYAAKDRGARPIVRNSRRLIAGTRPAWPWALG